MLAHELTPKAVLVEKFIDARSKTDALPGMLTLYHGTDDTFRASVTAFFQKKVTSNAKCGPGIYGTGIAAQDAFAYAYKCIIRYTHNYYAMKDYRVVWVNQ